MNKIKLTQKEFDELQLARIEDDTLMLTEDMTALTSKIFMNNNTVNNEALDELFIAKTNPELIEIIEDDSPLELGTLVTARYNNENNEEVYLLKHEDIPGELFQSVDKIDFDGFTPVFTIGELIGLGLAETVRMDIITDKTLYYNENLLREINLFKMKYTIPFFAMAEIMENPKYEWHGRLINDYDNEFISFLEIWYNKRFK